MDNPENLVILKILVQTDAVRFGVPFYIHLLFSYHAPFCTYILFALAAVCLLTQPISGLANGDEIPSEASYSVNGEWYPFIYGYTW